MDYLSLIATVFVLNLLAAMSPGPDFVMAVRNSLNYSRSIGIYTGFGIGLGIGVHILYCAAGIGFIISKSILAFNIIKFIGAGYLIYMGVMSVLAKKSKIEFVKESNIKAMSKIQALRVGFFTNVLNPKATMFFLGLFTFVINHNIPLYVLLIISLLMILTAMTWFTLVAVFFTQKKVKDVFMKFEKRINLAFGGLLILLGIKIALVQR
jgi:RhtB (resistance to homoserine/threonine) family protein